MTSRAEDIGTLLADNVVIRELNARIVPSLVAADDFWARYFFRADGLESSAPASGGERGRNADEESPGAPVQAGGGELGQREEGSVGGHAEEEAGSDFSVVPALREGEERDERVAR